MTATSTNSPYAQPARRAPLAAVTDWLARRFERLAHAASRRDRIEALEALSDSELARRGIRRDEIAYHVFRDLFYV